VTAIRQMLVGSLSVPSFSFANTEAAAYVAAMTTQPDDTRKGLIDTLVGDLKADGVWAKLDLLYMLASHDTAQASLLNMKAPAANTLVVNGTGTFTADRGYVSNGSTGYLNTGFNPSTAGGNFAQNSAHMGVWSRSNILNSGQTDIGVLSTNTSSINSRSSTGNAMRGQMNGAAANFGANSSSVGHFVISRTGSAQVDGYWNGAANGSSVAASVALINLSIFIAAMNSAGSAINNSSRQIAFAHVGAGLTATEVANLYTRLAAMATAIGV
jgi:hypothetical protein